jgi:glycosyltransferase involved in cell wall biosynthesis
MKLAFLGHPHIGGTYTVFRLLLSALAPSGIELRWLGTGAEAHAAVAAACWVEDIAHGRVVGSPECDERALGMTLLNVIAQERFDGVLVNVLTGRAEMNVARYLPPEILRIMLVHNITPGTYAAAHALRDHVHATIGVSSRIRSDLVARHGFDAAHTFAIPHAVEWAAGTRRAPNGPLRLAYLGRVEDAAKGVFLLPRIVDGLDHAITMTVAGDGPDLPELRARCAHLGSRVRFAGVVRPNRVSDFLSAHHALLMPSRFEGFGLTLIEAMAAGCVPVVTRLAGVTDEIVTEGQDGFLFPAGNAKAARRAIERLASDLGALGRMSEAARQTARTRFSIPRMAERYLEVIETVRASPRRTLPPLDPADWRLPSRMRPGLRAFVPPFAKNALRTLREGMAA